jgi:hypothetical protein
MQQKLLLGYLLLHVSYKFIGAIAPMKMGFGVADDSCTSTETRVVDPHHAVAEKAGVISI